MSDTGACRSKEIEKEVVIEEDEAEEKEEAAAKEDGDDVEDSGAAPGLLSVHPSATSAHALE